MGVLFDYTQTLVEYLPLITGAYIVILILRFPDLTIEASWSLGGVITCLAIVNYNVFPLYMYPPIGALTGALCGLLTGVIFKVTGRVKLLSGLISYLLLEAIGFRLLGRKANVFFEEENMSRFGFGEALYMAMLVYVFYVIVLLVIVFIWQKSVFGIKSRIIGEKPKSYHFFKISIDRVFFFGIVIANAIVGFGGGLYCSYHGQASNLQGIGLVIKAFFALLLGDELVKIIRKNDRSEPYAILVGIVIYVMMIHFTEFGFLELVKNTDLNSVKPTDKNFVIGLILMLVLWYRGKRLDGRKEVSEW